MSVDYAGKKAKQRKQKRTYYLKHREKMLIEKKAYYLVNREKILGQRKAYYRMKMDSHQRTGGGEK